MTASFRLIPWCAALAIAGVNALTGCKGAPTEPAIIVTVPPLAMIVQEIVGDAVDVSSILPAGSSPHTFELRPSVARQLADAALVFYVDDSIDGWVTQQSGGKFYAVFSMVPDALRLPYDHGEGHSHGEDGDALSERDENSAAMNAHFWSDPLVVQAVIPELVRILSEWRPEAAPQFQANGAAFHEVLGSLDEEVKSSRPALEDYALAAFHPSWQYFCHRYGINVAAYIEPFPGKEPTPRDIQAIEQKLALGARRIVLSEVQLPEKPALVLAESLGAEVTVIDPLGGEGSRATYEGLIRENRDQLWGAFE